MDLSHHQSRDSVWSVFWETLKLAIPFHSPGQISSVVLFWIISILILWLLRSWSEPVRDEIFWGVACVGAFSLIVASRFIWILLKHPEPIDLTRRSLVVGAAGVIASLTGFVGYASHPKCSDLEWSIPEELTGEYIRGRVIRIADLVGINVEIQGKTFQDCHFYGPAIFLLTGSGSITRCNFELKPEELVYSIHSESGRITGAIEITDCEFKGCWFHAIGFIANPDSFNELMEKFRGSIS